MTDEQNFLRVGIVSDVNADAMKARVYFPDMENMVSGWLYILRSPLTLTVKKAAEGNTSEAGSHKHTLQPNPDNIQVQNNGAHKHTYPEHEHEVEVEEWVPAVNDRVLCIYMTGSDTDGYILGAIP